MLCAKIILHNFNWHKNVSTLSSKKKMAQHSWLHTLLYRTGISQADLAGFLHISRSAVNMACRRERMLPTAALIQLSKIEMAMDTLPPGPGSPFTSYASLIKYFRLQARERRY
jgi:transcriptional regulator with XRE-family HTH domain